MTHTDPSPLLTKFQKYGVIKIKRIPCEREAVEDDVLVKVDDPDDALTRVILEDSGGQSSPDLLQVPHPVFLQKLVFGQFCIVNIWMLKFDIFCDSHTVEV